MKATEDRTKTPGKAEIYRCFLVRCRLEADGSPAWRFTVQQAGEGGPRHTFTCFADVAAHMQAELASCGALAADDQKAGAATQGRPYNGANERAQNMRRQKE